MSSKHTKFYLDKQNRKFKGVCAGIADYTGVDVTIIRIGLVILTFVGGGPWTIIAYLIAAWLAPVKPHELAERDSRADQILAGRTRLAGPNRPRRALPLPRDRPPARRGRDLRDQLEQPAGARDRAASLAAVRQRGN